MISAPRRRERGRELGRDLWIVGAGPSGLALAEACARRGVSVGLLAPDPEAPWLPNYGLWLDDAARFGVASQLAHRWESVELTLDARPRPLDRGYGLLDDRSWQRELLRRCREAGAAIIGGRLAALEHDDEGVRLILVSTEEGEGEDRASLVGKLVVDATGHGSPFVDLEEGGAPAFQVAWGELWAVDEQPRSPCFMDWSSTGDSEEAGEALPPTFLYALPLAPARLFVEETVLAAFLDDPPSRFEPLRTRLRRRLTTMGVELRGAEPLAVERCIIPMGGPLPRGDQRTLAFGGAAAMVHPATGYMLANVLARRERVAEAIACEIDAWVGPGAPSRRIWQAIWPPEEVRAWRLFRFGMEVLVELDRPGLQAFFGEFFELSPARWRGFLSASAATPELMGTMLRYFGSCGPAIRRRLTRALLGRGGWTMARGFAGLETG